MKANTIDQELIDERKNYTEQVKDVLNDAFNSSNLVNVSGGLQECESESIWFSPKKKKKNIFWKNLKYCWYHPWERSQMIKRFQLLAGIKTPPVARLILPDKAEIELERLPSFFDVIRYQLCGFKLTIYNMDDEEI